jgi:hypothetical protein
VFAVTAYYGANIVAFERLNARLDSPRGPSIDTLLGPISAWKHTPGSAWKHTPGIAARARRVALNVVLTETPADIAGVESALDDIVMESPASVDTWQARAAYQQARGAPIERSLASFRMSALTGSHEGYVMVERASFGLEHWSELPEVDRRIVMRDVLGTVLLPELGRGTQYRAILVNKSEAERDEIRTTFTASGLGSKDILEALGL